MTALLETSALSVTFGGLRAVNDVDLAVTEGQIVGLIGPNGAGKTTLIDAVTGFVRASGTIHFAGSRLDRTAAHRRARLGLGRTWQSLELFDDLTVLDNLRVAADRHRVAGLIADVVAPTRRADGADVQFALDMLGIADLARRSPSEISQGQRKLVGVARALAGRPRLLCMDEPAAGLDTAESGAFAARLRAVRDSGTTVLLVDHDMGLVLDVCDYLYVLDFGVLIASGRPHDIVRDPKVVEAYLGTAAAQELR